MKNILFRRSLVCGIILLFVGLSVTSSISGYIGKTSNKSIIEAPTSFPLNNDYTHAYWKFDECSGNIAYDSSGNGFDGTIYGATWKGTYPNCWLDFDGVDDYVDLDAHAFDLGFNKTDNYKISVYIRSTSTDTGIIYGMSHTIGIRVYAYLELNSNGYLVFRIGTEGCAVNVSSATIINDGDWHLVEVIYYGSDVNPTIEIYVDDEFEGSITDWVCPIVNADFKTAKIGRRSNNETNFYDGEIDDVKIYKQPGGNQPPGPPKITGPQYVKPGVEYDYKFVAIDPEGDDVKYYINWGDGEAAWTDEYYNSGEEITRSHTWEEEGTYNIIAKAKDVYGNVGPENTTVITVPKNKAFNDNFNLLSWLFERFPNAFPILRYILGGL